jgi:hypothetical protein
LPARAVVKSERIRESGGRGVILLAKKKNCGCGCVPQGKAVQSKPTKKQTAKKSAK